MHRQPRNAWVISIAESTIVDTLARLMPRRPRHQLLQLAVLDELGPTGLYATVHRIARGAVLATTPSLMDDPAWDEMRTTVHYANMDRHHIAPGADDLIPLSRALPPGIWVTRLMLDSRVHHVGHTERS